MLVVGTAWVKTQGKEGTGGVPGMGMESSPPVREQK